MRVLHVTDTFLPKVGGAEIAIDQLVKAMQRRGVDCTVLAQRIRRAGPEISTPYPLRRFSSPRSARWAGWWIERHIRRLERDEGPFDVLIGHHAFPPGYACVKHARRTGRTSIIYPRGGDIYEVSRFRKKPAAWRKLGWALANSTAIICASEVMTQTVCDIIGASAANGRLAHIPNGVNLDELRADASTAAYAGQSEYQSPFILALGRTIRRKGFDLLIEAFAHVRAPGWKLIIAGEGRELPALKALAAPHGDRILFTGLVQGAEKRWLLQNCRYMAAPSLEESFGNVALEAMACGRPVLASKASGFVEIVRDGQNGRLVNVADQSALIAALTALCTIDLTPLQAAATATAIAFSWDTIASRYINLIIQLPLVPTTPPHRGLMRRNLLLKSLGVAYAAEFCFRRMR